VSLLLEEGEMDNIVQMIQEESIVIEGPLAHGRNLKLLILVVEQLLYVDQEMDCYALTAQKEWFVTWDL
jgi:hypothetical protein